jgi:hypothetical protein
MKSHHLKMSDTQKLEIEDLASVLGMTATAFMRAVLYDGVKRVKTQAAKNKKETSDHLKLLDAKAKL